ncbi:artemin-like [Falco rusticolus]|uniref:artemin-like n=1 Tax=Falco rusticolus TaxID=120794 RepID=UPI0018868387|nr:artemin-like [Falco rusticolus]
MGTGVCGGVGRRGRGGVCSYSGAAAQRAGAAGGRAMRLRAAPAPGALRRSSRGAGRCGGAGRGARCPRLAPARPPLLLLLLRPSSAPPATARPQPRAAAPLAAAWRQPPPPPQPRRAGAGWRSRAPPRPAARTAEPQPPGRHADVPPGRPLLRRARGSAPPGGQRAGTGHGHGSAVGQARARGSLDPRVYRQLHRRSRPVEAGARTRGCRIAAAPLWADQSCTFSLSCTAPQHDTEGNQWQSLPCRSHCRPVEYISALAFLTFALRGQRHASLQLASHKETVCHNSFGFLKFTGQSPCKLSLIL